MKRISEIFELSLQFYGKSSDWHLETYKTPLMCWALAKTEEMHLITEEEKKVAFEQIDNWIDGKLALLDYLVTVKKWSMQNASNVNLRRRWYLKRIAELKAIGN